MLEAILNLGQQPLANAFLKSPSDFSDEKKFPLEVYRCADCSLVQLLDVISPKVLFRNYVYVTGTSETMASHNKAYAESLVTDMELGTRDLVIEIASNDGSFLTFIAKHGVKVLGIEPARNIAKIARKRGIETIEEFFDQKLAKKLRQECGAASVVVANNVLAHVDNPKDFLTGCSELVEKNGSVVTEIPYLGDLLDRLEYDTIYHEHLCYFSMMALVKLFEKSNLRIVDASRVSVHGGSLRVIAKRESHDTYNHALNVIELVEKERFKAYHLPDPYRDFADAVSRNREALIKLIEKLAREGKTIAGYGASAKGNTLLNYCGIRQNRLKYIVDRNPLKIGTYTPGTHILVRPPSIINEDPPDYLLILAWNIADEVIRQQKHYAQQKRRFIIPIPVPRIV